MLMVLYSKTSTIIIDFHVFYIESGFKTDLTKFLQFAFKKCDTGQSNKQLWDFDQPTWQADGNHHPMFLFTVLYPNVLI